MDLSKLNNLSDLLSIIIYGTFFIICFFTSIYYLRRFALKLTQIKGEKAQVGNVEKQGIKKDIQNALTMIIKNPPMTKMYHFNLSLVYEFAFCFLAICLLKIDDYKYYSSPKYSAFCSILMIFRYASIFTLRKDKFLVIHFAYSLGQVIDVGLQIFHHRNYEGLYYIVNIAYFSGFMLIVHKMNPKSLTFISLNPSSQSLIFSYVLGIGLLVSTLTPQLTNLKTFSNVYAQVYFVILFVLAFLEKYKCWRTRQIFFCMIGTLVNLNFLCYHLHGPNHNHKFDFIIVILNRVNELSIYCFLFLLSVSYDLPKTIEIEIEEEQEEEEEDKDEFLFKTFDMKEVKEIIV